MFKPIWIHLDMQRNKAKMNISQACHSWKNGYHSPNICQWNIYRCSNPYGFKNNVCKYIDSKIYMDSAHHQNNNQPRHARRRRNKAYGNWKLGQNLSGYKDIRDGMEWCGSKKLHIKEGGNNMKTASSPVKTNNQLQRIEIK